MSKIRTKKSNFLLLLVRFLIRPILDPKIPLMLHPQLHPNLDFLKLLQNFMDHDSQKLDPKEKRLTETENMFVVDLQDHQLLHMLNGPIEEVLVLVQLEEHEQVEVDFHPHYHHQKLELETYQGSWKKKKKKKAQSSNQDRRPKMAHPPSQALRPRDFHKI